MQSFLKAIDELQAEMTATQSDRVLSDFGKKQKLTRLNGQKAELESRVLTVVKGEISGYRRRYDELSRRERDANERAARQWDFQRLAYNTAIVKNFVDRSGYSPQALTHGDPFAAIRAEYNRARTSGDLHLWRSWSENGPAAIRAKYGDDLRATDVIREMTADLPKITVTPELTQVWDEQRALTRDILGLVEAVDKSANFFDSDYMGRSQLRQALVDSGLEITHSFNPSDLEHFQVTTISFPEAVTPAAVSE